MQKWNQVGKASVFTLWFFAGIFSAAASDFSSVRGIKDACVAGSLLSASHVPCSVIIFGRGSEKEAGCRYEVNGSDFLYTLDGSAKVDASVVDKFTSATVPRKDVLALSGGDRDVQNGCLVYATCAFAHDARDPQIAWSGIIAAEIVHVESLESGAAYGLSGHAMAAFESKNREVFVQINGDEPEKSDELTAMAKKGDKGWREPSTLIFCDHHVQALATFLVQSGTPR